MPNSEWGFEKLVYRDSITGIRRDRKYAIQAQNTYATGIHMSQNVRKERGTKGLWMKELKYTSSLYLLMLGIYRPAPLFRSLDRACLKF